MPWSNDTTLKSTDDVVIPAGACPGMVKAGAGIQDLEKHRPTGRFWMPAFAGMTEFLLVGPFNVVSCCLGLSIIFIYVHLCLSVVPPLFVFISLTKAY